ncbi:hypothetical protein PAEPH01_0456 [Pancytospora epiphaga]|nr:hypothetical protein PAEPH01_0456 [Pancytospora epiphaga]
MVENIFAFILGFVIFPLLYASIPPLFGTDKRKFPVKHQSLPTAMGEKLKSQITKSFLNNEDVSWINVIFQRIFADMSQNFAFELKIRNAIMKSFSFALKTGLIKRVRIVHIDFGSEAPFVTSVRMLRFGEMESLVGAGDEEVLDLDNLQLEVDVPGLLDDEDKTISIENNNDIFLHKNITHTNIIQGNSKLLQIENTNETVNCNTKITNLKERALSKNAAVTPTLRNSRKQYPKGKIEFSDDPIANNKKGSPADSDELEKSYKNLTYLIGTEYSGTCKISMEIELPKSIFVNSTITIRGFRGKLLLRLPAENYNTRYEFSFARDPCFDIEIISGLNTGQKRILFQNSISKLLKRIVGYSLRKMIVYPNWYQQYQCFLPSLRDVEHKLTRITPENIMSVTNIAESILTYLSNDFKIVQEKKGIMLRRSNHFINADKYINQWQFGIIENVSVEGDASPIVFPGMSSAESRLLNRFAELQVLEKVIPGFEAVRTMYTQNSTALIILQFSNREYEFIRIIYRGYLIFQRNDPQRPEFFAFHISAKNFIISSYNITPELEFTSQCVTKLHYRLFRVPTSVLGSKTLYKMMNYGLARHQPSPKFSLFDDDKNDKDTSTGGHYLDMRPGWNVENAGTLLHSNEVSRLEDVFCTALQTNNDLLDSTTVVRSEERKRLIKWMREDGIRMRLFYDTGRIINSSNESDKIRTLTVKTGAQGSIYPISGKTEEIIVHSYFGEDFIVDVCEQRDLVFIHRCELEEKVIGNDLQKDTLPFLNTRSDKSIPKYRLKLIYKKGMENDYQSRFIEAFRLRISQDKFIIPADELPFSIGPAQFTGEIKIRTGAAYFEFSTEKEDDFQFKVMSCRHNEPILQIYKIISNKKFRLLIPSVDDLLLFSLKPKHRRNHCIQYKLAEIPLASDLFIDCNIGLGVNGKFVLPIRGSPTHVVFWEKEDDSTVRGYLEDHESRNIIDGSGVIRAESRDYWLVYKNKEKKKRNIKIYCGMTERK